MNREADSSPSREPGGTLSSLTRNRTRAAETQATPAPAPEEGQCQDLTSHPVPGSPATCRGNRPHITGCRARSGVLLSTPPDRAESAICANCNQLITGCSLHSVIVSRRPIAAAHSRGTSADGAVLAEPYGPYAQDHVRLLTQAPRHFGKSMAASAASGGSLHRANVRHETCSGSQGDVFVERGRGGGVPRGVLILGLR